MTITRILVSAIRAEHIDTCFANPGTTEMGLLTEMGTADMKTVLCLHENVATGAADGFFRATRRPACTLLHLGPGLANGLSNLHNAKRAKSQVLNIIGEISTYHKEQDPPLASDIESLARTVSGHVRVLLPTSDVTAVLKRAMQFMNGAPQTRDSRVSTIIVPHDCNWTQLLPSRRSHDRTTDSDSVQTATAFPTGPIHAVVLPDEFFVAENAEALTRLHTRGVDLLCKNNFACITRGGTMPPIVRIAYFPSSARHQLGSYETVVFVNTARPVAMFGYQSQPEHVVPDSKYHPVTLPGSTAEVLTQVERHLKSHDTTTTRMPVAISAPTSASERFASIIAQHQPDDCIVVDESITFGKAYWDQSAAATTRQFRHMGLTGGSIGMGPACSIGAAVGSSGFVLNLQGDGSAAYTLPAFWTQSRYNLPIVTIILANNQYKILQIEQSVQRLDSSSASVAECTDLSTNAIQWESIMKGFNIPSSVVTTNTDLGTALVTAFSARRPYCIILEL